MHEPTHDMGGEPPPHQRVQGAKPQTMKQHFAPQAQSPASRPQNRGKGRFPPKRQFQAQSQSEANPEGQPASKTLKIGSKQQSSTIYTFPLQAYFPVFTTNQGLPYICETVFDYMIAQNPKLEISLLQFKYVTCVAFWNRLGQLKRLLNYTSVEFPDIYELDLQATGIVLPTVVAQYISAIGVVQVPNGTSLVPYIPTLREYYYYWTPIEFWREAHPGQIPPRNYWSLDNAWITSWINNVTRGGKVKLGLRNVNNTVTDGLPMMVVSSLAQFGQASVSSITPMKMPVMEADLGAAFDYRSYREYTLWPGQNAELLYGQFSAPPVYPRTILTEACAASTRLEMAKKQ